MWVLFVYMCHFLCVQALRCVYLCEYICVCWSMWVCDCVFVCSRLGECEGVIVQTRAFVLGLCAPRECGFVCLSMYTWFACVCVCARAMERACEPVCAVAARLHLLANRPFAAGAEVAAGRAG